jgi:transcriptional regulator with XRE-family HTH domain
MSRGMMTVHDLLSIFGRNIKFHRCVRRWSQEELAEKMSISKNTVCEIETGKKFVRAERLIQFAALFNVEIYTLFMPEEVFQNDPYGLITRFGDEVKDRVSHMVEEYAKNMKKKAAQASKHSQA